MRRKSKQTNQTWYLNFSMDLKVEGTTYSGRSGHSRSYPGKAETNKKLCSEWDSLAGLPVYLKVQQFRLETDHVPFSESKAFPWVPEDLNLGPHACSYSLSLFLNPMCILQDSCRLKLTANLCKIHKSYRKPGFPRANWACNREVTIPP